MTRQTKSYHIAQTRDVNYLFENNILYISGNLYLENVPAFTRKLLKELRGTKTESIIINLEKLQDIDSAGVTALSWLERELKNTGIQVRTEGAGEQIIRKTDIFKPRLAKLPERPTPPGLFEYVGDQVIRFFREYAYGFLELAANVFYFAVTDFFRSKQRREGEVVNQSVIIGANAVLIVMVMTFVIGLVLALQSAEQLRDFGANIYIVDLTVIAMISQMGPLITAILVAGRSGSAIAAEIATMRVTSELDALQTMGLNPIRFVVVPKLYASLFTMPFLIILAIFSGILGGAIAAYTYLDITPEVFLNRMPGAIYNIDIITAFIKSQVYACLIVLTGAFYGFGVIRGAEGVGKATTSAVVVAISLVIVADSAIGLIFY